MDLSKYKELYLSTAKEYVTTIENSLLALQSDPTQKEAIDSIHLSAHSLKSQSQVMGFTQTAEVCKRIEFIFKDIQNGTKIVSTDLLERLTKTVQALQQSLISIEQNNTETDLSQVLMEVGK